MSDSPDVGIGLDQRGATEHRQICGTNKAASIQPNKRHVTPFGELLLLAGPQPTTRYITQPTIPLPSYSVLSVMDDKRRTKSCADVGIFMFNMRQCWRLDPSP